MVSRQHHSFAYKSVIGFRPNTGDAAKMFLEAGHVGSEIQAIARDDAILTSVSLQRGASVDDLRHSLTRLERYQPARPVCSLLDLFADECSG